jgi:hypothetical protein
LINIDVDLGLTTKATGFIRFIVKSENKDDPDVMLVEFDNYKGRPMVHDLDGIA